ncbi:hypothetical protein PRBEI_2001099900 [Prionailurus iriomotensis]
MAMFLMIRKALKGAFTILAKDQRGTPPNGMQIDMASRWRHSASCCLG